MNDQERRDSTICTICGDNKTVTASGLKQCPHCDTACRQTGCRTCRATATDAAAQLKELLGD